jgi:hypothetical protein
VEYTDVNDDSIKEYNGAAYITTIVNGCAGEATLLLLLLAAAAVEELDFDCRYCSDPNNVTSNNRRLVVSLGASSPLLNAAVAASLGAWLVDLWDGGLGAWVGAAAVPGAVAPWPPVTVVLGKAESLPDDGGTGNDGAGRLDGTRKEDAVKGAYINDGDCKSCGKAWSSQSKSRNNWRIDSPCDDDIPLQPLNRFDSLVDVTRGDGNNDRRLVITQSCLTRQQCVRSECREEKMNMIRNDMSTDNNSSVSGVHRFGNHPSRKASFILVWINVTLASALVNNWAWV